MLQKIGLWIVTRLFQVTSLAGYAVGIWAYLGWDPSSGGVTLLENFLKAFIALLLFVVNEKPWLKK